MGVYYRFPKTKNEATQCSVVLEYCEFFQMNVRSKRQAKVLPDLYNNDFSLVRERPRSWKSHRQTQWRDK